MEDLKKKIFNFFQEINDQYMQLHVIEIFCSNNLSSFFYSSFKNDIWNFLRQNLISMV